jgi:hypothetical protein
MDTQRRDPPKLAQASPAAVQTSQRKTKEQSSSGMQGPQHEPFRVGTVPAGQSGSGSSQEGEYPQLRVRVQRPVMQRTSLTVMPEAVHTPDGQNAGHEAKPSPSGSAAHMQQSSAK